MLNCWLDAVSEELLWVCYALEESLHRKNYCINCY